METEKKWVTDYDKLLELVRANGMDYNWSKMFVKKLRDDETCFEVDDETRKWALERGFYPGRVQLYQLTEENYRDYMPDYNYFMMHPLNHHFRKWLDKLTLKYVLNSNGCEASMPEYYVYVEKNGNYTYLMDFPANVPQDEHVLLNLLKAKKLLAIKPNSGTSGGRGFMKMEWKDETIFMNNKEIGLSQFHEIIQNIGNNIVTEYCTQHEELARIWPYSECTLRVIMAKLPSKNIWDKAKWHNVISYARFGSEVSGGASNLSSGGMGIGFNFETGEFKEFGIRYKRLFPNEDICYEHPDTHVAWKGFKLPNWQKVRERIDQVCQHVASLDYLGLDVIITPDGMKLCEINSHPAMDYEQIMNGPVLKVPESKLFFESHGLNHVNCKDFYDMYMQSRVAVCLSII